MQQYLHTQDRLLMKPPIYKAKTATPATATTMKDPTLLALAAPVKAAAAGLTV
jgi:hypothetical protein